MEGQRAVERKERAVAHVSLPAIKSALDDLLHGLCSAADIAKSEKDSKHTSEAAAIDEYLREIGLLFPQIMEKALSVIDGGFIMRFSCSETCRVLHCVRATSGAGWPVGVKADPSSTPSREGTLSSSNNDVIPIEDITKQQRVVINCITEELKNRQAYLILYQFCSCRSFAEQASRRPEDLMCKHYLAVLIAEALNHPMETISMAPHNFAQALHYFSLLSIL